MHNRGYDLYQVDQRGNTIRWCEVKAMRGTWQDRPVGLTHTQFKMAQEYGAAYWLYVVERAGTGNPNIVKIQDPAGQARTFTFDHGWRKVAVVDGSGSRLGLVCGSEREVAASIVSAAPAAIQGTEALATSHNMR